MNRKSSSVKNNRGRKCVKQNDAGTNQNYYWNSANRDANASSYSNNTNSNVRFARGNNQSVTRKNCREDLMELSRSKSNSRKRGAVIIRGKDSRNAQSNPKQRKVNVPAPNGVKTIEYADKGNFRSIITRSNTVNKYKIGVAKLKPNEGLLKPYTNFAPSINSKSNITIDVSENVSKEKFRHHNQVPALKSNNLTGSKKAIGVVNEYQDDSMMTINSNNFGKRSNLNTIIGICNNNRDVSVNSYKTKSTEKDGSTWQALTKVTKKDGLRTKSNKRSVLDNLERVYVQSPLKLITKAKQSNNNHLNRNIKTYESEVSIKEKTMNFRDASISPIIPNIKDVIGKEQRNKTTVKKRSVQNLNSSMKQETSSGAFGKDRSKFNLIGLKNIVSGIYHQLYLE